jgi:hypothetical protein
MGLTLHHFPENHGVIPGNTSLTRHSSHASAPGISGLPKGPSGVGRSRNRSEASSTLKRRARASCSSLRTFTAKCPRSRRESCPEARR